MLKEHYFKVDIDFQKCLMNDQVWNATRQRQESNARLAHMEWKAMGDGASHSLAIEDHAPEVRCTVEVPV